MARVRAQAPPHGRPEPLQCLGLILTCASSPSPRPGHNLCESVGPGTVPTRQRGQSPLDLGGRYLSHLDVICGVSRALGDSKWALNYSVAGINLAACAGQVSTSACTQAKH